jgi:hypothetical protein
MSEEIQREKIEKLIRKLKLKNEEWNALGVMILASRREIRKMERANAMPKFMQTLDNKIYTKLLKIAKERGITIQELIRTVIITDWLKHKDKP